MTKYKFLDNVNFPSDIKNLKSSELITLSKELREELIEAVSFTGGHLGAGLGVVELTVALHHVFDTPNDKIVWDVGHQSYPHKILTGRKNRIKTLRQGNGLSGFTKRSESEYDPFGAAHSSTSISAALGIATANKLSKKSEKFTSLVKRSASYSLNSKFSIYFDFLAFGSSGSTFFISLTQSALISKGAISGSGKYL